MADQQDHLTAATGVDVDDAPAPTAPPSAIVIFWRRAGRRPERPCGYPSSRLFRLAATSQLALPADRRSLPLIGRYRIQTDCVRTPDRSDDPQLHCAASFRMSRLDE
jgi:hypothetical protein